MLWFSKFFSYFFSPKDRGYQSDFNQTWRKPTWITEKTSIFDEFKKMSFYYALYTITQINRTLAMPRRHSSSPFLMNQSPKCLLDTTYMPSLTGIVLYSLEIVL